MTDPADRTDTAATQIRGVAPAPYPTHVALRPAAHARHARRPSTAQQWTRATAVFAIVVVVTCAALGIHGPAVYAALLLLAATLAVYAVLAVRHALAVLEHARQR